jgi:hypothetical protein
MEQLGRLVAANRTRLHERPASKARPEIAMRKLARPMLALGLVLWAYIFVVSAPADVPNITVTGRGGSVPLLPQSLSAATVRCGGGFGGRYAPAASSSRVFASHTSSATPATGVNATT